MKKKWNVDPEDPTTLLRLVSELEGSLYILECLKGTEEEVESLTKMKRKYYKKYFHLTK